MDSIDNVIKSDLETFLTLFSVLLFFFLFSFAGLKLSVGFSPPPFFHRCICNEIQMTW